MKTSNQLIKKFSEVSNLRGALDLLLHCGAIGLIFWGAHHWNHWLGYVIGLILISGLQHGLLNLSHDAWHYLCFKPARLNDFIAAWFYSYVLGVPFRHDRQRHFQHHRRVGHADDPDRVNYCNDDRVPLSKFFLFLGGKVAGGQFYQLIMALLRRSEARIATEKSAGAGSLLLEYAGGACAQLLLLGGFYLAGRWWEYFVLWFLPLITLAPVWAGIRAFVEHSSHQDDAVAEERLYDFHPSMIEAFFISPCHFNYHALHHSYPTVPHHRLRLLKKTLLQDGVDYMHRDEKGYISYLRRYFSEFETRHEAARTRPVQLVQR